NFDDQTVAQAAIFPEAEIDILIIEATRGDTPQSSDFTRGDEEHRFGQAVSRAFERGGCVLIPVFALGKTQEVLAMFHKLRREQVLGKFPIYVGGLSTKLTEIYDRHAVDTRRQLP